MVAINLNYINLPNWNLDSIKSKKFSLMKILTRHQIIIAYICTTETHQKNHESSRLMIII